MSNARQSSASTASRNTQRDEQPAQARFFNRDLSWLEFNRRVLWQAEDPTTPLLDRVRFLSIFTSNLDEFFMKRVGLIKRQIHAGVDLASPDGMKPRQVLSEIRDAVSVLQQRQADLYAKSILPELAKGGVHVLRWADLSAKERSWVEDWYLQNVFPALTPLAVNPTHRFPFISNLSDNIGVVTAKPAAAAGVQEPAPRSRKGPPARHIERDDEPSFARVKLPPSIHRFIRIPSKGAERRFIVLQDVLRHNLSGLFPGMPIEEQVLFRVTRSSGIQKDDLDTANLLQSIEADLKQRRFARVVRLELEETASTELRRWLIDKLNIDQQDVYERPANVDFLSMTELADLDASELKRKAWKPVVPARLTEAVSKLSVEKSSAAFFGCIRRQDILVHHPYESFNASVERFIASAASDPDVLTIKQTLYRTSPDSPFIENLVRAAENGKQVACLVELRARFDEGRNVRFARQLEKAGVHVAYGVPGLKTHCKTSLVVRRERQGLRCYAHLGTGNYHPKTAQLYTDVGLFTADAEITSDLVNLFNFLTGLSSGHKYDALLVAPFTMRAKFNAMIDREIAFAKKGKPARIFAKINAMEDREITEKLYEASQAGVKITLVVRGFCCLRPGVPGLSENIRVMSVVGRFLEHSRIFHFAAGQDDPLEGDWYIGSADWMYRNLSNRVEVAAPVRDPECRRRLLRVIEIHQQDCRNAWDLAPTGSYELRSVPANAEAQSPAALGTFEAIMSEA